MPSGGECSWRGWTPSTSPWSMRRPSGRTRPLIPVGSRRAGRASRRLGIVAEVEALYRTEALEELRRVAPEVAEAIAAEVRRQQQTLELIASENFASRAVMAAQGLVMTNKHAEGYPGRRYYGGYRYVDIPERLAIERAQALFGAEHVNVQPHSGAQA